MRWPLRNQIMWPLLAVALVSLGSVGAINARLATRQAQGRIERQLEGVVGVLEASNFPLTDAVLRQMRDLSSAEFVLSNVQGDPLATSFAQGPPPLANEGLAATRDHVTLGPSAKVLGESYFHTTIDLRRRWETPPGRVLHILFPQAEYRRAWREAFVPAAVIGMGSVAAVAAVAHLVAGRISRAAARVGREVARLARGDFASAPLPGTDDELRDLSIAVNRTAEMLADYENQVRRTEQVRVVGMLGASLAHEMRNAATGCRVALDLHAESCGAGGEEESLAVAKRQLRLMESQLQRFLQAGRPSAGRTDKAEVDLRKMIENLLPLVRPAAQHAHVQLDWLPPTRPLEVRAAEEELSQVVLNLVLNALEAVSHHREHGDRRVSVAARPADAGQAEIVVSDSGPGPANGVAAAMFDPFVTSKAEGAGLGLAVAKQVVEAHDGAIRWNRHQGVTRFSVTLPLAMKG